MPRLIHYERPSGLMLRAVILGMLHEEPGLTAAELARRLGATTTLMAYHVSVLLRKRRIVGRRSGRVVRLYVNGQAPPRCDA